MRSRLRVGGSLKSHSLLFATAYLPTSVRADSCAPPFPDMDVTSAVDPIEVKRYNGVSNSPKPVKGADCAFVNAQWLTPTEQEAIDNQEGHECRFPPV